MVEEILLRGRVQVSTVKKHERFAMEYLVDFDMIRAYKSVYDEDGDMEDIVAQKCANRLLRSVTVMKFIDEQECKFIGNKQLEKERVLQQLQRIYFHAMKDRDYAAANASIEKMMKHLGLYNEHQKQRRYSADELVGIRQKLEAYGISLEATNKPTIIEIDYNGTQNEVSDTNSNGE